MLKISNWCPILKKEFNEKFLYKDFESLISKNLLNINILNKFLQHIINYNNIYIVSSSFCGTVTVYTVVNINSHY